MFQDATDFSVHIETMVVNNKDLTHIDAIIDYCAENMLEPEDIKDLISIQLKMKLANEFMDMRYLPRGSSLEAFLS